MKKIISLFAILSVACFQSFGQNNIIKLNLSSAVMSTIGIQDEYSLNGHSSIALGFSYTPTRGVPGVAIEEDQANNGNAEEFEFGGFSITPEYRYYFKGNGPKGLYLAPYLRYAKYTTEDFKYTYDAAGGLKETVTLDGDYSSTTFGLMIGSQWTLGENWTLDWWIVGAGFGSIKGEYTGTPENGSFSQQDQDDFKKEVGDIDVPLFEFTAETTSSELKVVAEQSLGFRGFGLCLGYRF